MAKSHRLNLRLTADENELLHRAAEGRGESTSEYVLRRAIEAAEADLADRRVFVVNDGAWQKLQAALHRPAASKPHLARLLASPSVLERG